MVETFLTTQSMAATCSGLVSADGVSDALDALEVEGAKPAAEEQAKGHEVRFHARVQTQVSKTSCRDEQGWHACLVERAGKPGLLAGQADSSLMTVFQGQEREDGLYRS